MLRNRRKNGRKKNVRKNRNNWKTTADDDEMSSDSWHSITTTDSDFDSDDSFVGGLQAARRRRMTRSNTNAASNRRLNSDQVDRNEAGPSSASSSSNSRSGLRNGTAKRKFKDRAKTSSSAETSSNDDVVESRQLQPIYKRQKTSDVDTDNSDSVILANRRTALFDSESNDSSSDEVVRASRRRTTANTIWSDETDSSMNENTAEASGNSSPVLFQGRRRPRSRDTVVMNNYMAIHFNHPSSSSISSSSMSSSSSSSSSSLSSNSLFSVNSSSFDVATESSTYSSAKSSYSIKEQQLLSSDSDSSDTDGEKCAICLKKFKKQRIGNPSNCDHNFCVTCIEEWSKSSTTCPVDRSTFDAIIVRNEVDGNVIDRIEVQSRNFGVLAAAEVEEVLLSDSISCEICGSGADEETLLLCDLCNLGYHMACLNPPLQAIPAGSWYCPSCRELHNTNQNMTEAIGQYFNILPAHRLLLVTRNGNRTRISRPRPVGPPPRGRGPTFTRRLRNHNANNSATDEIAQVIRGMVESESADVARAKRKKNRQSNRRRRKGQPEVRHVPTYKDRVSRQTDGTLMRVADTRSTSNVDLVFPTFNLFGNDNLDYFSDDNEDNGLEGEVAIMARVRREYSARRIERRKNMFSSLMNNYQSRTTPVVDLPEIYVAESTSNLLDSILESQTLWHSKNVEISSNKDGKLEIKLKEETKKPDLTNTNHSSKEIPLFPNKNENNSSSDTNKTYTNNSRYSNLGGGSSGGSNSFSLSSSSFNSLNPSTRPGFSNILGNSSPALDLSPFRGAAPIRFRMNPPRPAIRRPNFNSNSIRHGPTSSSSLNSVQSPRKTAGATSALGGEDDVDLYDDIESETIDSEKMPEMFSSLEPPPEPPALLMGGDSSSSDEDDGLVIDDKAAASNANKSNIYDPTDPNEESDVESNHDKNTSMVPGYLRSPSYGGLSEFGPHLPLPEPPALPIELDSVNNSEEDDDEVEAECPNMTLYSSTSINLANNVQDIPIPESAYPSLSQEELEYIPIPSALPSEDIPLPEESSLKVPSGELYSPTKKGSTDSSSEDDKDDEIVEIGSDKSPRSVLSEKISSTQRRSSSIDIFSSGSSDDLSSSSDDEMELVRKPKTRTEKMEPIVNGEVIRERKHSENDSSLEVDVHESTVDLERTPTQESSSWAAKSGDEMVDLMSAHDGVEERKTNDEVETENPEKGSESEDDEPSVDNASATDECQKRDDDDNDDANADTEAAKTKEKANVDETTNEIDCAEIESNQVDDLITKSSEEVDESVKKALEQPSNEINERDEDSEVLKDLASELSTSNAYLLPSEDLDPVSDVEYNDFPDYHKQSSSKDRRKKRKRGRKRDASVEVTAAGSKAENRELEEGEIEEDRSKRKRSVLRRRRKSRSVSEGRGPSFDKKQRRKKDRRDRRSSGKENKESTSKNEGDLTWKKLSKSTKERNYRDKGKAGGDKASDAAKNRERETLKSRKEKRKEIERYDVRRIVSDKPRTMRDEFGRDISVPRSRSRSLSAARSYSSRRRSKGPLRRSFSQDDRWIDWSPVWTQRRSRSRTRRSKSRSRNRSRLSGDRYRNRSRNRDRDHDKRDARKRRRSVSSTLDKYSPATHDTSKKRRRSKERARRSGSYTTGRPSYREVPDYVCERSWSRSISYASLTPEPEPYVTRYERSPSIIDGGRIPAMSPDAEHDILASNSQNLTVIVPNVDASKKKHKKKKESKKKKKKQQQPSKEVFTSGDNIVVSVNFDDNQKIISAKSSKRKHDDDKPRKKKKDETTRKRRKQTLHVSDEVLNAKPVAVIDLNSSPCKEMSPTEVILLTDSGDDENNVNESAAPTARRTPQEYGEGYQTNDAAVKSPSEHRPYVMTSAGPKTPPEPPIKFTVGSAAPMRTMPTNPIFEQDEELENEEVAVHYNKGPNTPPEPSNETRRSITPSATMYDPFEPTKSRSPSPVNTDLYEEHKDTAAAEERRPIIDMFSEDGDKTTDNQNADKIETDNKESESPLPVADDTQPASKTSPVKETLPFSESSAETTQTNAMNTLVLDLSSLGDDFVPKSSIPLVKTSQGKYEFQSGKAPDKPITVVIAQQSTPVKPQPQQVMVIPTRQVPTKPVEPIKQPIFPDILPWKLPPPLSQPSSFSTPPPAVSTVTPTHAINPLMTPSKSAPGTVTQNGGQDDATFELDDSPYSPASSEGDDLFEPPPLNSASGTSPKGRPTPIPAVNSYKTRVDALFSSSPIKKLPPPPRSAPQSSKPVSAIKGSKKVTKTVAPNKKEVGIKADEEQLKILDDVPNSAVEMIVKEKFLKKLHRQERVVEEVKVVLKPHYAKKHISKDEYKDILRRAVPKICHNKSGDINPSKIQSLVEAYVKKIRHSKKKGSMLPGSSAPPMFPSMTAKPLKKQKTLWS